MILTHQAWLDAIPNWRLSTRTTEHDRLLADFSILWRRVERHCDTLSAKGVPACQIDQLTSRWCAWWRRVKLQKGPE